MSKLIGIQRDNITDIKTIIKSGGRGPQGLSAYEVWLQDGNQGTVEDFFESLKGEVSRKEFEEIKQDIEQTMAGAINEVDTTIAKAEDKITDVENDLAQHKLDYDELVGTTMSYDDYFSLSKKDIDKAYFLDKTKDIASAKKVLNLKPSLLMKNNKVIAEKLPIQDGLKIWVDSRFKQNTDVSKAIYNDLSGNNNNGDLLGFDFNDINGWNDGLVFDGIDDKVRFNNISLGEEGFSLEIFTYIPETDEGLPNYNRIVTSNSDYIALYHRPNLRIELKISTAYPRPNIPLTSLSRGEYSHITATCSFITGDIKLYLNGQLISETANEPFSFSINTLFLGSYNERSNFLGKQKFFRFYDRPLSEAEVLYNYEVEYPTNIVETPEEPVNPQPPVQTTTEYSMYNPLFIPKKVRFIGHRGLSGLQPENTIPAFEECGEKGMWGVETDIRVTSDGEFVCMHDATVDRTTNGTGNVTDLTLAQIKELTIDYGNNVQNHTGLKVPTLEEMLIACSKYGLIPVLHLYIDIAYIEPLVIKINELGFEKTVIYTSTSPTQLRFINSLSDSVVLGLGGRTSDLSNITSSDIKNYGRYLDSRAYDNYPESIKQIHAVKQVATTWVINDVEKAKDFINRGIDMIATDVLYSL